MRDVLFRRQPDDEEEGDWLVLVDGMPFDLLPGNKGLDMAETFLDLLWAHLGITVRFEEPSAGPEETPK